MQLLIYQQKSGKRPALQAGLKVCNCIHRSCEVSTAPYKRHVTKVARSVSEHSKFARLDHNMFGLGSSSTTACASQNDFSDRLRVGYGIAAISAGLRLPAKRPGRLPGGYRLCRSASFASCLPFASPIISACGRYRRRSTWPARSCAGRLRFRGR